MSTEAEFRFRDDRRILVILRNNAALFRRRAKDSTYGTHGDRAEAWKAARDVEDEISRMEGKE